MSAPEDTPRHEVAVLVRPGVRPMELGLVHQILGGARSADGEPLYRVRTCALHPGTVPTDADFRVVVEHGPELLARADTVVVLATQDDHEPSVVADPGLGTALASLRPGTRLASICTAAFPLAEAGLLDGRRATTHWLSAEAFRCRFPRVDLDPAVLYVDEGEVLTAAGEASGIDLCLYLVRRDFGAAVANDVARRTVVPPYREGGQAQYIPRPVADDGPGTGTAAARERMLADLARPWTLAELAASLHVGVRTLTRRFREETGQSPLGWLLRRRVERARELLESTDLPVGRIADEVGFGTATALRRHVCRELGVPPLHYRRTFRGG
jgi:transcriptional regulator GlxA family with amidase domain